CWAILNEGDNFKLKVRSLKFVNVILFWMRSWLLGLGSWVIGLLFILFCLSSFVSNAQVTSSVDSTKIKIGEQITYKIEVETNPDNLVVFPEGQTFLPLEMIDSYPVDTIKNQDKYNLIKKYGLT